MEKGLDEFKEIFMAKDDILQRSDCFNCGSEATYEVYLGEHNDNRESEHYIVECCNIDCPVSSKRIVANDTASGFVEEGRYWKTGN